MPKQDEYLTTATVARRLGCDVRTVHRMVRTGRLKPEFKLPGRTGSYVFALSALESVDNAMVVGQEAS